MPGRTPRQAIDAFVGPLQAAVSSVTSEILITRGRDDTDVLELSIGGRGAARIRGEHDLTFEARLFFTVVPATGEAARAGPLRCHTVGYQYEFRLHEGVRFLAFHYHPARPPSFTHIHVYETAPVDLTKVHIPSGRVSLEAVIRLAITEFGVEARDGTLDELAESERVWETWRTWV